MFAHIGCAGHGDFNTVATVRLSSSIDQQVIISGIARVDRRTKRAVTRLRPGEIAVIDHADIDALMAHSLAECKVSAVVNARPFVSGRYPNRGPEVLSRAGIPLYELPNPELFDRIPDGKQLSIDILDQLILVDRPFCELRLWDDDLINSATADARGNLSVELERFARNTLEYLDTDKELLLDPTDVPEVGDLKISGHHALIVVRGEGYKEDLAQLKPYIRDVRPVLIAIDGGADALREIGYTPDIILGDMDSVSDESLQCGARLIVHAYARRSGEAPGMERIRQLGLEAQSFAVPGTSEDAGLLLAYEHGADLIVAVGTHSNLEDFLDKGRAGMASTFLVRLKVGPRLVDARGVCKLYKPAPPPSAFLAVVLSAMFPILILMQRLTILQNIFDTFRLWLRLNLWRLHFH